MSKTQKRIIFLRRFSLLTQIAQELGIEFIVTCFYRSEEEQYREFLDGDSQLDGRENRSPHQDWLAIDICIIEGGHCVWPRIEAYETLGTLWKQLGGTWGGDWESLNDIYHFQYGEEA